ncbi:MAG: FadR family transcriptional regulator [Firmicutes bacterium]|nr:FadR family transcriptional regulator [Bacillota bacterium]
MAENIFSPAMLKSVEDQITEHLIQAVVDGRLKPGDRLVASDMAAQFGVCRSTIVSVMQLLSAYGIVQTKRGPRGGSYIKESPLDDAFRKRFGAKIPSPEIIAKSVTLEEFCVFRETLETAVCISCMQEFAKDPDSEIKSLLCQTVEDAISGKLLPDNYNVAFHTLLASACGNTLLARGVDSLDSVVLSVLESIKPPKENKEKGVAQHKLILEAIIAGDEEGIRKHVKEHIDHFRNAPGVELKFAEN